MGHGWVMDGSWRGHVRFQCVMDQKVIKLKFMGQTIIISEKGLENSELQAFLGPVLPLSGPDVLCRGSKR